MSEKGFENVIQCVQKPKMMSSNVSFGPQPKDSKVAVIEKKRCPDIFPFKRLVHTILTFFILRKMMEPI